MKQLSTKLKITLGYLLLTVLLITAIGYIYTNLHSLTQRNDHVATLSQRRRTTNEIINQLNRAEIIGQSLSTGQLEQYANYKEAMLKAGEAVDSLRSQLSDSLQLMRLDTVSSLLVEKEKNMRNLLYLIRQNDTDALFQQQLEALINEQDSLLNRSHVRRKVVTHTQSYTIQQKPKSFFRRLGEVFAPSKKDSTLVNDTILEEYTDSLTENYNPTDTILTLLKDVQNRVADTQQKQLKKLNRRMLELRLNSLELNGKVHQLLATIEDEGQTLLRRQQATREDIRNHSAHIVAGIALVSVLLVIVFLVIIGRDITRSNHYRRELEKAKQRAEDLLEAREKLMLTITHDIKAPIGSILGYTDLMERITQEERQRFYLNNMQRSANHLLRLVNSLLDFHRLDADKMEVNPVAFNPKELFDTLAVSYQPMAENKHLSLRYECDKRLNNSFNGDPFRIRQITENLLSNALKFTSQGHISLQASWKNNRLQLTVSDTGCGISPEEQAKIFQEFTRLKNAQGAEGFGLGLAITQKLVHLLKGEIRLSSEAGKGSRFEVSLPLEELSSPTDSMENDSTPSVPHLRLLLIDDDRLQLQLTSSMLEHPNLSVTTCLHPDEVFKHLREAHYDLLLTDIQMPAMNGFELLKAVRKEHPQLPVIALTARNDMGIEYYLNEGFVGKLNKPFTQKELLQLLAEVGTGPSLDFSALTAFSMDDAEAAAEIMRTFISETTIKKEKLQQALKEKDMQQITSITHQLLPLFKMLKAERCIDELLWFETKREETTLPTGTEERIRKVLEETERLVQEAEKRTI